MDKHKPLGQGSSQPTQSAPGEHNSRQHFRETLLTVVDTQISDNSPPETRLTFERLLAQGHSQAEARRLIACALTHEMHQVLKEQQPYQETRYVQTLQRLPQLPWE